MSKKQRPVTDNTNSEIFGENEPAVDHSCGFSLEDAILYPTDEVVVETTYTTRELIVKKAIRYPRNVPDWTTLYFRGQHERAYILRGKEMDYMLTVPVSATDQSPPKLTSPERSPENEIVLDIEIYHEEETSNT